MPLFQKAPASKEEADQYKPLDISPDQVLEMTEEEWYEKVYRGDDVPQLTWRAVIVGSVLGFLLAWTNLYIGLKTGWGLGVAITACILAFAMWNGLLKIGVAKSPMTILETNCMQSTASSAGYSTGGTMVSAITALLMLSVTKDTPKGEHLPLSVLILWTVFLAALGTLMAIPMKRNMINRERLKFPSGTAAAVTLQSLYSEGAGAVKKARALIYSSLGGAIFPIILEFGYLREKVALIGKIPGSVPIFDWLPGRGGEKTQVVELAGAKLEMATKFQPSDWTMVFSLNPVMIAAGAIVGLRTALYMVLGGVVLAYFVGPPAFAEVWTSPAGDAIRGVSNPHAAWKEVGLWLGVPIMVASGLLTFAMQWRTIARAFSGFFGKSKDAAVPGAKVESGAPSLAGPSLVSRTEVPITWFIYGTIAAGAGVVILAQSYFQVPWYYGALAVAVTFFLALVACRATGESDITPVGAMGKIMQLTYGVLIPQSTTANLMTAGITAGSAGSSADLLNDLKSGYLLGANPRRQFIAQACGIFAGTAATVIGFRLLVPDASVISDGTYPAPAAQAWAAVARLFANGIDSMHPMHRQAIFWGLALGVTFTLLEKVVPKYRSVLPSATGLGLGLILPFEYPLAMAIGAVIAWVWVKKDKKHADDYLIPVASGVIAGVSIMGVLVAILDQVVFARGPMMAEFINALGTLTVQ